MTSYLLMSRSLNSLKNFQNQYISIVETEIDMPTLVLAKERDFNNKKQAVYIRSFLNHIGFDFAYILTV